MAPRERLDREIEQLEGRLDQRSGARTIDELATVRRGLATGGGRRGGGSGGGGIELTNVRLGFACKQRWEDMVGDDRVRACGGCNRPVFNLSEMTRADAEAVLATRGLTPCVRFYRRPDGTVMTTDCPTGVPKSGRRLAVVASSLAAGATLAAAPVAMADPPAAMVAPPEATGSATTDAATPADSTDDPSAAGSGSAEPAKHLLTIDHEILQGLPIPSGSFSVEMGEIISIPQKRPAVEWSVWGRLGMGVASQRPDVLARRVSEPATESGASSEAAAAVDLTFRVARDGDLRLGAWGEVRTSSDPVAGAELVLEDLPPHPYDSRIGRTGSLVLRAGGNARVITGALGFGYVGSFPRSDPWIRWARHVVGARVVVSMNRAIDDPHDWSATVGLEVEPFGAVHALFDLVTGR